MLQSRISLQDQELATERRLKYRGSGPFEPHEAEIEHDERYGREPRIPDMDFESEAYYEWEEEMADDVFRRSWEEREEEARDRKELWREGEMEDYYGKSN